MPSLVDPPPELIEKIHLEHEQLVLAELSEQDQQQHGPVHSGALRLMNRYMEAATRHSFLENFEVWQILAPDDACIQKFCTMAKTSDLATTLKALSFTVDDDYSMRAQGAVIAASGSDTEATHVLDEGSGGMVPAAYFGNGEALLEAFRVCVNVTSFWFVNRPLDDKPGKRCKRESRDDDDDDVDDDDDDEDESGSEHSDESDTEDIDDDGQGSEDGTENDDEDEGEGEQEDEDEAERDAESEDGAHVNSNVDQEDENDDDEDQPGAILYDITSSYNYVLLLAGQADLCPERIMTDQRCSEQNCACPKVGLTDCTGLWRASPALKKLRWLKLNFIEDQHEPRSTLEGVGARLGKRISEGLAHIPVLEHLILDFHLDNSADAWSILAKAPVIPTLIGLHFDNCKINMHDLVGFLGKHAANWKFLNLGNLHLINGSVEDLARLYKLLSQAPKIDHYYHRSLLLDLAGLEHATLPSGVCYPLSAGEENEDGLVEVYQTQWLRWKGHEEVT